MRIILCLFAFLLANALQAQYKGIEIEQVDNGGLVKGKTIRVYIVLENDSDQVHMVYGDKTRPMEIRTTKQFHQSTLGGATSRFVNRKMAKEKADVRYDSWLTIGAEDNYDNNTEILLNTDTFEKQGGNIITEDGAWYCLPGSKLGYAGVDKRVLIMQLTSEGDMSGKFSVMGRDKEGQVFQQYDVSFEFKQSKK